MSSFRTCSGPSSRAGRLVDRTTGIRFEYDLPTFSVVYHRYQVLLLLLAERKPDGNSIQHECQGSKRHR
jgi:hypothetical protein